MKRRQIPPAGGKYEETGRAIGAMERPAIQPAMKEGEKPSSKKSKHKDDACGQRGLFSQDIFDSGFGLVSIAMAGFIIVDSSANDPKVK